MLNVTDTAQAQVARFFEDNTLKPIRIFLANGCGGAQVAMALDEAHPEDTVFEFGGVQYVVNKAFLAQAQPIVIDFTGHGFKVSTALTLEGGCGGCGCGSSEGCGS